VAGYLDAASGAPIRPEALAALNAAQRDAWADPGRRYGAGRRAARLLDTARQSVADGLGARPDELSFCANGTAALHAAVLGTLAGDLRRRTLVHSRVEHSAVLHAVETHVAGGGRATAIGVDAFGRVDVDAFRAALTVPDINCGVLQAANHEVGTTQPVTELAAVGPPLVLDATQTAGHAEIPSGWSVLAADARMWGGPPVGVLAVRTGVRWRSPAPADEREFGRVPGLPNVAAIAAAAVALEAANRGRDALAQRHRGWIDRIRATAAGWPDVEVLGDPVERLPHIVTFSCLYADGESLLAGLDRHGIAVSSGSSCTASTLEPSHVLVAMGALTSGNIRVSLHHETTEADVEEFLAVFPGVLAGVRDELGAAGL
jgi:cysteine desulfurase